MSLREKGEKEVMDSHEKEVYFGEYCSKCRHEKEPEDSDVCNDCLNNPSNIDSHKPIRFEARK